MPSALSPEVDAARARVAATARRLAAAGLVIGTAGNLSERADDLVAITPTGAVLQTVQAEDISVVDLEGAQIAGDLEPTSELDLHLGTYTRYGAGGVVHTHSPMATALSCVLDELPTIHYQLMLLGGPVRVAEYRTFGTPELAEVTLDALDGRFAALMANHGAITFAHTVDAAADQSLLLEWGCELYYRASAMGTPRALDEQQRNDVISAAVARNYGTTQKAS